MDMNDIELDNIAMAVLDAEPHDEEIGLIALDRAQRGYLTIGHVAAILNWVVAQNPTPTPPHRAVGRCGACHRSLTDVAPQRRGYAPSCWAKVESRVVVVLTQTNVSGGAEHPP